MLIDLVLKDERALVVGEGREPEYKALRLVEAKAKVTVMGRTFTEGLRRLAAKKSERVRLMAAETTRAAVLRAVEETHPKVIFVSTGRPELDEELSEAVRGSRGRVPLICVVDEPRLNDFNMPAIAKKGDITVGVSTGGKSPAMAGILRGQVEKAISRQDVLQVRLQGYIRKASRKSLKEAAARKAFAYEVIRDEGVGALLKKEKYADAKRLAEKMLKKAARASDAASRRSEGAASHG